MMCALQIKEEGEEEGEEEEEEDAEEATPEVRVTQCLTLWYHDLIHGDELLDLTVL